MQRIEKLVLAVLFAAGVTLAAGCSSSPDAAATASSMDKLNLEMAKVNDSIDQAVKSLKTLVESPGDNLKSSYDAYSGSVKALEAQSEVVRTNAEEMKARGDEFFKEWQEGSGTGVSQETQAKLNISYAKIKEQMMAAKDGFVPFLTSLKDVETYLALELTPTGLQKVGPLASKAQKNATDVKSRITGTMDQINAASALLSRKPAS